jgi:hypothetical protein
MAREHLPDGGHAGAMLVNLMMPCEVNVDATYLPPGAD